MKCPNCGSESSGKFCIYCGSPMHKQDSAGQNFQTPPDNNSTSWQQNDYRQQNSYQQTRQQDSYQQDFRQANGYSQASYSTGTPDVPPEYRPISMWGYFGYEILFSIPCVGLILLLIFSFGGTQNINLRNFARSYFCLLIIAVILFLILAGITGGIAFLRF